MKLIYCLSCFLISITAFAFENTFYFNTKKSYALYNTSYNGSNAYKSPKPPLLSPVRHTQNNIKSCHKIISTQHNACNSHMRNAAMQANTNITSIRKTDEIYCMSPSLAAQWQQQLATNTDPTIRERLNTRINALSHKQTITISPPYIHQDTLAFARRYNIDLYDLIPEDSPCIAHVIYKEYVDILEATTYIPKQHTEIIVDALGEAASIGLAANKAGIVEHASRLADFCWTVLNYTKAVGQGIYLGATNTLHTLTHPLQTAQNALIGIGVITYGLVNVTDFVHHAPFLYVANNDQFFLRLNAIQDQLQTIASTATTYLTSNEPRTIVKDGAAFITEGFLFGKIVSFAVNLTKQILPLAMHYAEYIAVEESFACLADGELIPIKMTPSIFFNTSSQALATTTNAINFLKNINECLVALSKTTKNKIHHILTPNTGKHAWHLVVENPLDWKQVAHVIEQVLIDGTISPYGPVFKKELSLKGHIIEVIIAPFDDGSLSIVDAWVKTR